LKHLLPPVLNRDFNKGIELIIEMIANSQTFRSAEENFQIILPFIDKLSLEQIKILLQRSAQNGQVYDATLCAKKYLPPLLKKYGKYLAPKTRSFLIKNCARYV
jgi:hypothetical protein